MSTLQASDLHVRLGGREVLTAVSGALDPGMLLGVIGPNGAGKTTLLRALAGLQAPASGTVMLDDVPLAALSARDRARILAYLPQQATAHWDLTVRGVVMLGRLPHRGRWAPAGPDDEVAVDRALAEVGAAALAARPITELSGGERARVMLARALAGAPRLLLADEPVAGLDPYHRLEVMEHLAALAAAGRGVGVVLHDLALAARFCTRILLLDRGRVAAAGPPGEVLTAGRIAEVYRVGAIVGDRDGEAYILPWTRIDREPPSS